MINFQAGRICFTMTTVKLIFYIEEVIKGREFLNTTEQANPLAVYMIFQILLSSAEIKLLISINYQEAGNYSKLS
jgi:hypothetical protein